MDEEIERLVVSVRADTSGFARDVEAMRASLEGPLTAGAERAGRGIEAALVRSVRTGELGFEQLRQVAVSALDAIAAAAIHQGVTSLFGPGGLGGALAGLIGSAPGRATGGPVSPARPYWVGERGPELFVPTSAGRVEAGLAGRGGRDVRVSITVNAAADAAPLALQQSSRQVARAVRAALMERG